MVGLGNPGPDFLSTRHNAGFWFVDRWAGRLGLAFRRSWFRPFSFCTVTNGGNTLVLAKPLTFMNRSGDVLPALLRRFRAQTSDLLVVFDQMDLPPGRVRLKPHGSSAGHNGLKSLDQAAGSDRYHRLAIGIGRPEGPDVIDHVLGVPTAQETEAIDAALDRAVSLAAQWWSMGWEPLLNAVNQRDPS